MVFDWHHSQPPKHLLIQTFQTVYYQFNSDDVDIQSLIIQNVLKTIVYSLVHHRRMISGGQQMQQQNCLHSCNANSLWRRTRLQCPTHKISR